jgi:RNA methyltransferase, TrmH family
MITVRKLARLPERTRIRKAANVLGEFVRMAQRGDQVDRIYIRELLRCEELLSVLPGSTTMAMRAGADSLKELEDRQLAVLLDDLQYLLLGAVGASVADWDLHDMQTGTLDRTQRVLMPFWVYLDRVRSPFNVGSLFRTADSFGVTKILLEEGSASPKHPRAVRSARGCIDTVDWEITRSHSFDQDPHGPVFALELGGTPIDRFTFPARGTVIVGSEELGVSPEMLAIADRSLGRVSIPLAGTKGSLNVSVAFGILMQHWYTACTDA